jgi:hypothetical protein
MPSPGRSVYHGPLQTFASEICRYAQWVLSAIPTGSQTLL